MEQYFLIFCDTFLSTLFFYPYDPIIAKTAIVFGYDKFYVLLIVIIGSFFSGLINIYLGSMVHQMVKNQQNTQFLVSKIQKFIIPICFVCFFLKTMPFLLFFIGFAGIRKVITIILYCIFYILYI